MMVVLFVVGGVGLVKGGIRGMVVFGKVGVVEGVELIKIVLVVGKVFKIEGVVVEGVKVVDVIVDVIKVIKVVEGVGVGKVIGDGVKILCNGYLYEFDV